MSKSKNKALQGRRNRRHHDTLYVFTYDYYDIATGHAMKKALVDGAIKGSWLLIPSNVGIRMANPAHEKMLRIMQAKP